MDPKELRANAPLSISVSDDSTKYAHGSPTLAKNKSYHEIGSSSMGKVDAAAVRPCAIIGPDRVHPQNSSDVYLKKTPAESWPCTENTYRQPPDYPNRLSDYPTIRNISPRQTFQENMQRIMVPPTYSSIKNSDDSNLKNTKLNMPQEAKFCDVPYNMNPVTNELKSVRNSEIPIPSVNPAFSRGVPHYGWPAGVNIRPPRPYGAPEMYQYPDYPSCVGPRPVTISHPHRVHRDEAAQVYSERLYQEANIRFKPYPTLKEKHQQTRYDYISNYQNSFHPPVGFPPHKPLQTHPYPMYPQVPLKYFDRRIHETLVDGYQRSNQQPNYNPQFQNQNLVHPPYGPISGNCVQNKTFTDLSAKPISTNKLPYESNKKMYLELDTSRHKNYPVPENVYYNDTNHAPHLRGDILLPNRSTLNMHSMPQHQIYRRDTLPLKHFEYNPHYRNMDPPFNVNYTLPRLPLQYSPNTVAISPSDSNTSNDTIHTIGTSQEDCGYVSQSSTNSVRSLDGVSASKDIYRRHDYNVHAISRNPNASDKITKNKSSSSSKKNIDVRQFLQMWNEGEEEANDSNKEVVTQIHPNNFSIPSKTIDNQEQLYVLGLVNVPNEELGKYEHIQKISKLPENIKGYNSIELLNQYEELLESPSNNNYKVIPKVLKDQNSLTKRPNDKEINTLNRPVSPLDVEAKISQSVIHKEVGCNFEIKPCSPEMLNAEIATPIHSILGERRIEKVANPLLSIKDDNKALNSDINNVKIASCNMINKQYSVNNYANITKNNNFNVQDLESNSGISLASLPRLDNDIELNFPEINQQFIKANKLETGAQMYQNNLTLLNLDQITQEKNNSHSSLSPQFCLGSAPEKEFSKLSKYRKSKKCDNIPKEDIAERNIVKVQQRINSVIIKNPDTKLQDENVASLSISNNESCENIDNTYNSEQRAENLLSSINAETSEEKNMSFDTAIDFSLNKTEVVASYNKCTDEPHYFSNSHNVISESIIDKEIISEELPLELQPKPVGGNETFKETVIVNKEPKEYSKIEEDENDPSVTYKLPVDEFISKNNIPVIKNSSIITEIEEYNIQENNTSIGNQQEMSLLETSTILHLTENLKDDVTETVTYSKNIDKNLVSTQDEYKVNYERVNPIDNRIDQNEKQYEEVTNESNNNSEAINTINVVHKMENKKELLVLNEKGVSLNTMTENSGEETISNDVINKIDEQIMVTSQSSNQELDMNEVSNEIGKKHENCSKDGNHLKLSINVEKIELEKNGTVNLESFSPKHLTFNTQLEVIDKSSDNNSSEMDASNDYKFVTNYQEMEKINVKSPSSVICELNAKCGAYNSSKSFTFEHTECREDENFNSNNIIKFTKHDVVGLENNNILSTNKEKEDFTNNVNAKFNLYRAIDFTTSTNKNINITKELYSPWIQKLIIFREGICANIQNYEFESIKEKNMYVDILLRNADETLNENIKIDCGHKETSNENNSIFSGTSTNEIQNCDLNIQTNVEYGSNVLVNDLSNNKNHVEENLSIQNNLLNSENPTNEVQISCDLKKPQTNFVHSPNLVSKDLSVIPEGAKEVVDENLSIRNNLLNLENPANEVQICCDIKKSQTNFEHSPNLVSKDLRLIPEVEKVNVEETLSIQNNLINLENPTNEVQISCDLKNSEINVEHRPDLVSKDLEDIPEGEKEVVDENLSIQNNLINLENPINEVKFFCDIKNSQTNAEHSPNLVSKDLRVILEVEKENVEETLSIENNSINLENPANEIQVSCDLKNSEINVEHSPDLMSKSLSVITEGEKEIVDDNLSIQNNLINSKNSFNEVQNYCDVINPQTNVEYSPNEDYIQENLSVTPTTDCLSVIRRNVLKRSLSESALEDYKEDENIELFAPSKRKKRNLNNIVTHPMISEDLSNIIQTNRRNSVSTFYNEENVFILIDNELIITEENDDSDKMYYTEISHDFDNDIPQNECSDDVTTIFPTVNKIASVESPLISEEKPVEESWVEDVACIETVVSDDITDDIDYEIMSPKKYNLDDETISDQSAIFCDNKHIDKIKNTYGSNICNNDTHILQTLYMTPQMNVNKTLLDIESRSVKLDEHDETVDEDVDLPCKNNDSLDKKEENNLSCNSCEVINEKENINTKDIIHTKICQGEKTNSDVYNKSTYSQEEEKCIVHSISGESTKDYMQSPKNTISNYSNSSSPEVSSTTPEEKNSSILLKITNHNGSRISKVNEIGSSDRLSYKLTENKDYHNYNTNFSSSRTLITKAAQKYIPPLKESIRDLKIKLTLPQHRLQTLKQLKVSKVEPKIDDNIIKYINKKSKQEIPKKPKPKFEDVLKSIDEIQFQKHKDKIKKGKNGIPKVVIKKNENGAHFASCRTANVKDTYNPDLTGRKWQPWVFLEKNNFIDKMAIKNKVKAVYCHRKKNYVLAEKFYKYKSIFNANFIISQPNLDNSSKGTLKYTIKLKHK